MAGRNFNHTDLMLNDDHLRHQLPEMGTSKMRNDTMKKQFTPEFSDLMRQYRDTAAGLGHGHPIVRRLWVIVVAAAPGWFRDEMHETACDMGLVPEPIGCDDDGNRLYSLDAVADRLGIDRDEARREFTSLAEDARSVGLAAGGPVSGERIHRLH